MLHVYIVENDVKLFFSSGYGAYGRLAARSIKARRLFFS